MKLEELISEGRDIIEITDDAELKYKFNLWCSEVKTFAGEQNLTEEKQGELRVRMHYSDIEYSGMDTAKSIRRACQNVLSALEQKQIESKAELTKKLQISMIERILDNFYLYYRAMYRAPVHRSGTLTWEILKNVQIGNEYDLQRMLYALLLPLFPALRQEVNSDNGYGGVRADLYVDECDLIIEAKCTRRSMTEKKLTEELGADVFHYRAKIIYLFIYDKGCIIKNPMAFKKAFERMQEKDGKTVKAFIVQPVEL